MRVSAVLVASASLVFACVVGGATSRADDSPAAALPSWKKGEQEGVVKIDGQDEKFVALAPAGYSPKKPCAAVLLLHGNGGKAADFKDSAPIAEKALAAKSYEVIVLEHNAGHSTPAPEMKDVFAWIDAVVAGKKTTLATRRIGDDGKGGKKR